MPPKCSQLMAPLSAAAVQAAMSGACVGQGVRVTWREEEDERWTTWRGVFLCTLAFLSFTEKNVAIVFWFDDDDPGTLPSTKRSTQQGRFSEDSVSASAAH
jgi:hypothetical protein